MADEKKTTPEEKKLPETNAVEDDALHNVSGGKGPGIHDIPYTETEPISESMQDKI